MNFNIADNTIDQSFIYLMKINPEKPFGKFKIKLVMKEISKEQIYKGNSILMKAHQNPVEVTITRTGGEDDNIDEIIEVESENEDNDDGSGEEEGQEDQA